MLPPVSSFSPSSKVHAQSPTVRFGTHDGQNPNSGKHLTKLREKSYDEPRHIESTRKLFIKLSALSGIGIGVLSAFFPEAAILLAPWAAGTGVLIKDVTQKEHALGRNFPGIWRGRVWAEMWRPELQQYFIEKDTDELPLSREQRSLVYSRAKGQNDKQAFGTLHDLNKVGTEWLAHSILSKEINEVPEPRITIGGPQCKQPYNASIFNTSGMSFGALSKQAVLALAKGAYLDNFFLNTGEGGISPFHLGFNVDIDDPNFDMDKVLEMARTPMTEAEATEARRDGKEGLFQRGLAKRLPLRPEEKLAAIHQAKQAFIEEQIKQQVAALTPRELIRLGMGREQAHQQLKQLVEVYQAVKSTPTESPSPVPERKNSLPIAGKNSSNLLEQLAQQIYHDAVSEPEPLRNQINEALLLRVVAKMKGATTPAEIAKIQQSGTGRMLKTLAAKLRLNTMQYTRFPSGDIVWNIGTGYFGCRNADGTFSPTEFRRRALLPQVKMIELKLSQGAKPGGGGVLPAEKVTPGLAKMRGIEAGKNCLSPARHSAFSTPVEMMQFIQKLRDLSGGKPVGFKLCVGEPYEFIAICKAMQKTGIYPDFITIDGAEGGTGAAPAALTNDVGMPLNDAIVLVNNVLVGMGLRDKMKVIAAGKVVDEFDIISKLARGADACNSARSMMLSIGCIMARQCHTNKCPVGVATQNPELAAGLDPDDKGLRNASYHHETVKGVRQILGVAGLTTPSQMTPQHIKRRVEPTVIKRLSEVYDFSTPRMLAQGNVPEALALDWDAADPDSFLPRPGSVLAEQIQDTISARQS